MSGTVTKVEWQNPHVYAYLDVKDPEGKVANWKVEMGSPDALSKGGWTRTSVKVGDQVTIQGWRAKNNMMLANAQSFTLPDGRKMAAATSLDMQNQQPVGTTGAGGEGLPATASPLVLDALIGGLAAAGALGLRAFRR